MSAIFFAVAAFFAGLGFASWLVDDRDREYDD
mgnify:FL=1